MRTPLCHPVLDDRMSEARSHSSGLGSALPGEQTGSAWTQVELWKQDLAQRIPKSLGDQELPHILLGDTHSPFPPSLAPFTRHRVKKNQPLAKLKSYGAQVLSVVLDAVKLSHGPSSSPTGLSIWYFCLVLDIFSPNFFPVSQ